MSSPFSIDEQPVPVPAAAASVDLIADFSKLLVRCSLLETQKEDEERAAREHERKLLLDILDIADALERILDLPFVKEDLPEPAGRLVQNIRTTNRLLSQRLKRAGVARLDLKGSVVDTEVADVEDFEINPGLPDETVIQEIVAGYTWNGDVLRRAKVVASRCP